MERKAFGTGLITADHIYKKEKKNDKYFGTSGGGSVGNTLCMLSLLEFQAEIFGVVGNDPISDVIINDLEKFDVSHSLLKRRGELGEVVQSRQYSHLIDTDKGKHYFKRECLECGIEFQRRYHISNGDLTEDVYKSLKKSDVVHFDRANKKVLKLAEKADEEDIPITVDLGYVQFEKQKIVEELLKETDLAILNESVFEDLIDEKGNRLDKFKNKFPKINTVIITQGKDGLKGYSTTNGHRFNIDMSSVPCENFIDGGGSGDILSAILISELILNKRKKSKKSIKKIIKKGQALASLNCTLYGARALQRAFLKQELSKTDILKIADNILENGKVWTYYPPDIGIPEEYKYEYRFIPKTACSVCGGTDKTIKKENNKTEKTYIKNLDGALGSMSSAFETNLALRDELKKYRKKPMIFVGSGGSLSAGIFAKTLMLKSYGFSSVAIPPYAVENIKNINPEYPFCLISYGGENPDIIGAAYRLAKRNIDNCIVFCGNNKSKLKDISDKMNWDFVKLPKEKKRSFVSTTGMLSQISAISSILLPDKKVDNLKKFFEANNLMKTIRGSLHTTVEKSKKFVNTSKKRHMINGKNNLHIVSVASGWGMPAMMDFESKLVEGGVCTVEVSEMKNFTHGRYMNTFKNRANRGFIIFESPDEEELSRFLQDKLDRYIRPLTVVKTSRDGVPGSIELVLKSLYLAWNIGKRKDKDISSPQKYPPEARGLYGWKPSYREDLDIEDIFEEIE